MARGAARSIDTPAANTSGPQPLRRAPPAARRRHKLEPREDGRGRSAANLERGSLFGYVLQPRVSLTTYAAKH
ncbi:unnamed protein product [Urochloa decumbens]|uniref:Uncharacterized protein n=1 Tax=Urochloa decumbens TaxID=240449 RepID=A0ABC8WG56_9POAL